VVLYEMLTGVTPFQAEHEAATLFAIVHEELKPATSLRAGLPLTVDRVLGKAMAKNPQVRYQHVDDLLVDLRAVAKGLPVAARPVSRRPRWVLAACGAAAFALAALITAYAFFWRPGRAPADEGQALRAEFTQLTSEPGIEWFPSLSPDGKWLVYAGESGGGRHIFLRGVGGQNPLDLSRGSEEDDDQPAFSPDGERIAFRSSRGGGGIFIMGRTGEAARRVTATGFNPAWSPDGSKLVFNTDRMELYPQNAIATSELWVVEVGSGQTRRLPTDDAVTPNWSPHNQRIAFASRVGRSPQGDVWTIPAGGGTPVQVTNDPARDWNPVWAPDGKHLYFASDRGGNMNLWRVAIDEATGKTRGAPEPVTTPAPYLAHISLSADGKRIAYTAALITANIQQLSLDPAGNTRGEAAWVTTGTRRWSSPDPSPDGEWIAFYSLTQPEGQVFVSRPDGSDLRQLTKDASDRLPRWPPDGRWLSFFSDRSGTLEVWRIRPDGSGLQQLSKCGCGYHVWSPDGTRIAATAGTVGQESRSGLVIFDPNRSWSEQAPEIIPPLNESGDYLLVNSWSPDGRMLAGQVHSENPGIAAYSLATRAYRRIANFGEWPVFLPDSQRVLFVAGGKGFYLADLRSGQVRKIYSVARDVIGPPRLTRDGKKAYFSRRVTESDIWLASLR
jgi:Tol biopolymer transport system component